MDFDAFVRESRVPLLRFAGVLAEDVELAQDLVQEVLLRAQASWPRIAAADHPYAYLRRMLVNEAISWHRKWGRIEPRPTHRLDDAVSDPTDAVAVRDDLLRRLTVLPARQKAAIVLRYLEDLSDDEIADALGCSIATVRVHIHRGLRRLRVDRTDPVTYPQRAQA